MVCLEKWSLCGECWKLRLNIIVDGKNVCNVWPHACNDAVVDSIVNTDANHTEVAEIVFRYTKCYAIEYFLQNARKTYLDDIDMRSILPNAERAVAAYRMINAIVSNPGSFSVGWDEIGDKWMVKRNLLETTSEELVEIAKRVVADNAVKEEEEKKQKQKQKAARNHIKKLKKAKKDAIYLVKWSGNWADEIDFNGYSIMYSQERIEFEEFFGGDNEDEDLHICFGTNEDLDCTRGEYLSECEFIEITEAEQKTLEKCICLDEGWAPSTVFTDNE